MPIFSMFLASLGVIAGVLLAFYPGEDKNVRYAAITMLFIEVAAPILFYVIPSGIDAGSLSWFADVIADTLYTFTTIAVLIALGIATGHRFSNKSYY